MDDRPGDDPRVAVAVSACLFGDAVRYDGADKRHDVLRAALDLHVRWVPLCPEVLAGLGVPRPPIRLVEAEEGLRVREVASRVDRTPDLEPAITQILRTLEAEGARGFVFKARSPSCGVGDAAVFREGEVPVGVGDGLLAEAVRRWQPDLPIARECDLETPAACAAFLARVRAT